MCQFPTRLLRRLGAGDEEHVEDGAGEDAHEGVPLPGLERDGEDAGRKRPRPVGRQVEAVRPVEPVVGIGDEPRDDDGGDKRAETLDGRRQGAVFPRKEDEGQGAEREGDERGDGDRAGEGDEAFSHGGVSRSFSPDP